jgi:hypothetical protein
MVTVYNRSMTSRRSRGVFVHAWTGSAALTNSTSRSARFADNAEWPDPSIVDIAPFQNTCRRRDNIAALNIEDDRTAGQRL